MQPTLLVLAAGMGSRYGGLKQVDPVGPGGETLMDYAVYDAIQAGFGRVVFVIRSDFEAAFRKQAAARFGAHVALDFAIQSMDDLPGGRQVPAERAKPWGTAHAVRAARKVVREPFAAINADDYYGREAFEVLGRFLAEAPASGAPSARERLAMVGFRLQQTLSEHGTVARGVCSVDAGGRLLSVGEHTRIAAEAQAILSQQADGSTVTLPADTIVSMNMWGFTPAFFALMEEQFGQWLTANHANPKAEWFIPLVVNNLLQSGRAEVRVLPTRGSWFGITYRDDRPRTCAAIAQLIAQGVYPARLWG
ncbi:MAG: NTP transferase domain-containing protein [Kiritimatiellae bacterium]|nr:NTP transferase domain-containing protein [Kiritimatiellia bacterium]